MMGNSRYFKALLKTICLVVIFWVIQGFAKESPSLAPFKTSKNCKCGVPGVTDEDDGRIVGGKAAQKYKWKWQVSLTTYGVFICGASLITDRHILTTAHCAYGGKAGTLGAVLNEYDFSTPNETITITRTIKRTVVHPQYDKETSKDYDVAVMELNASVNVFGRKEPFVTPVCLPSRGNNDQFVGRVATVTGWGRRYPDKGNYSESILREVDVPVISNKVCQKHYDSVNSRVSSKMLCAGYSEGGKDACQGDSGGPLVLRNGSRYTQIGITDWGYGCARDGYEGVYARVTELNEWIRSEASSGTWCTEP